MTREERRLFMEMGETIARIRATLRWSPGRDEASLRSTNDADELSSLSAAYDEWFWQQPEAKALMAEVDEIK